MLAKGIQLSLLMGPVIPVGWRLDNATTAPNVQFWEYNSTDLNGNPLDVSQRAAFSRQLTAAEAAQWSDPALGPVAYWSYRYCLARGGHSDLCGAAG